MYLRTFLAGVISIAILSGCASEESPVKTEADAAATGMMAAPPGMNTQGGLDAMKAAGPPQMPGYGAGYPGMSEAASHGMPAGPATGPGGQSSTAPPR